MRYRKKPVVIEAIQWRAGGHEAIERVTKFTGDDSFNFEMKGKTVTSVYINTLEGAMKCSDGDYIIKGVKGEFYPCKPDIFEMTYEPVEESYQFKACGNNSDLVVP